MRVYDRRIVVELHILLGSMLQQLCSTFLKKLDNLSNYQLVFLLVHLANEAVTFCRTDSLKVFCQVYVGRFSPRPACVHCENVLALTRIGDDTTIVSTAATTRHFVPPFLMASPSNIFTFLQFCYYIVLAFCMRCQTLHALILGDVIFYNSFIFFTGFGS